MDDLWVFWAAYKEGSFPHVADGMDKDVFYNWLLPILSAYSSVLVVEDVNRKFKQKWGVVCFIAINTNGCRIEPHVEFFKWATKSNILRVNVRFFNWCRYQKDIAVCVVKSLRNTVNLFHHVRKYGVLNYIGRIPNGDPLGRGDEYLFSVKGKKE